jgi:8-oxo-dGTP diphosphatase
MAAEKLFYVGVKSLIENDQGKVLLFHSPGWAQQNIEPHWDMPGGRIDVGEDLLAALKREIYEETGIQKNSTPKFFTATISNHISAHKDHGITVGLAIFVYTVSIAKNAEVKISDEHTEYEWVDKEEAAKRLSHKYPPEFTSLL